MQVEGIFNLFKEINTNTCIWQWGLRNPDANNVDAINPDASPSRQILLGTDFFNVVLYQ